EHKAFVYIYLRRPAITNRKITKDIQTKFSNLIFNKNQFKNLRYVLKKEATANYNPF
ncbi:hypothetical protein QBC45DRAFT_338169, partial [Copromyces sp. CBS 386.78]